MESAVVTDAILNVGATRRLMQSANIACVLVTAFGCGNTTLCKDLAPANNDAYDDILWERICACSMNVLKQVFEFPAIVLPPIVIAVALDAATYTSSHGFAIFLAPEEVTAELWTLARSTELKTVPAVFGVTRTTACLNPSDVNVVEDTLDHT